MTLMALLIVVTAQAQTEVLVLSSRPSSEARDATRTRSVVESKSLEASSTIGDALRPLLGVDVVRQGAIGQPTSLFIRGSRSEDTLVLIDGIEMNDAGSTAGAFDFSTLSPDRVSSAEVLRGPQAVRYGPGAIGGVVAIETEDGSRPGSRYRVEGGSYDTYRASIGDARRLGGLRYSLGVDHLSTRGFSASAGGEESDGAIVDTVSAKLAWTLSSEAEIQAVTRYSLASADLDRHGGPGGDDPNATARTQQTQFGLSANRRWLAPRIRLAAATSFSEVDRQGRNPPDSSDATDSRDHFLSATLRYSTNTDWLVGDEQTLRIRLDGREETAVADSVFNGLATAIDRQRTSSNGASLTYLYESETWFGDLGARADKSSVAGWIPSKRASFGRAFGDWRLFASYGTGFKLPSLYQLYSTYGDPGLREEQARSWELTLEKSAESSSWAATYYRTTFDQLIDFDLSRSRYFNVASAASSGVELRGDYALLPSLRLTANYTYTDARDSNTGLPLLRRPQHSWSVSARYTCRSLEAVLGYLYRGVRVDLDPVTFARIGVGGYGVLNANASYNFGQGLRVFVRAENLLDTEYQEVAGYGTARISGYLGVSGEI